MAKVTNPKEWEKRVRWCPPGSRERERKGGRARETEKELERGTKEEIERD